VYYEFRQFFLNLFSAICLFTGTSIILDEEKKKKSLRCEKKYKEKNCILDASKIFLRLIRKSSSVLIGEKYTLKAAFAENKDKKDQENYVRLLSQQQKPNDVYVKQRKVIPSKKYLIIKD
jgi:hypothetical protein